MIDNHVHIGQFADVYYDPLEVADVVMSAGMEGMAFSSTGSCGAGVEYAEIEKETAAFLSRAPYAAETLSPLLWYIPDYMRQNIAVESAFGGIPYRGIKLHPYAHNWDFGDVRHMETLHGLFDFASANNLPVLIHTGNSGVDSADRFERFIAEYRGAKCILAHCRPLDTTIKMLEKYINAYCDTSFVSPENIRLIADAGFANRIFFGSDFPITHFFKNRYPNSSVGYSVSLREQYAEDTAEWEKPGSLCRECFGVSA